MYLYKLTTSNGRTRYFYVQGMAELYRSVHGGVVEQVLSSSVDTRLVSEPSPLGDRVL
jgi:hypothetical protein